MWVWLKNRQTYGTFHMLSVFVFESYDTELPSLLAIMLLHTFLCFLRKKLFGVAQEMSKALNISRILFVVELWSQVTLWVTYCNVFPWRNNAITSHLNLNLTLQRGEGGRRETTRVSDECWIQSELTWVRKHRQQLTCKVKFFFLFGVIFGA